MSNTMTPALFELTHFSCKFIDCAKCLVICSGNRSYIVYSHVLKYWYIYLRDTVLSLAGCYKRRSSTLIVFCSGYLFKLLSLSGEFLFLRMNQTDDLVLMS